MSVEKIPQATTETESFVSVGRQIINFMGP